MKLDLKLADADILNTFAGIFQSCVSMYQPKRGGWMQRGINKLVAQGFGQENLLWQCQTYSEMVMFHIYFTIFELQFVSIFLFFVFSKN